METNTTSPAAPVSPALVAQRFKRNRSSFRGRERPSHAIGALSNGLSTSDAMASRSVSRYGDRMSDPLTLTAVFTPDENGWTMAQLAEWPAVVTCGRTVEEAREMLLDAAREMVASYRDEGREPPVGGGHVEQVTIDVAAA